MTGDESLGGCRGPRWSPPAVKVSGLRGAAVAAAMLALAILSGCSGREASSVGGSPGGEGFPIRMTDAMGVEVVVAERPERIVSAAPTVTEILFALGEGERVVAVTDHCNYPPEAQKRSRIGGFWNPSAERTLGARPDLVIGQRGNPPDYIATMRRSGTPVFTVNPQTVEDVFDVIEQVAGIIGEPEAGRELTGEMRVRLEGISGRVGDLPEERRPTAFLVLQVNPPWTAGRGTFQHDLIRAAGGRNAAEDVEGFRAYGIESLAAKDPDYILLSTMNGDPERMRRELLSTASLRNLTAVREGRLLLLEADPLMRPGPRVMEAVEAMARAFHPELFAGE